MLDFANIHISIAKRMGGNLFTFLTVVKIFKMSI